jgi:hypothetical protein
VAGDNDQVLDDILDPDHMRRMVGLFMDVHDAVRGFCIPCRGR